MKLTYLLLALPLAVLATVPFLNHSESEHPHPHGQEISVHHLVASEAKPLEAHGKNGHVAAARAELRLATMNMAREAVVNAGVNDEDMDLAFNLEYGLADLSANSEGSDADISADFSLDNELADLTANSAGSDAGIDDIFSLENKLADLGANTATADAEINALFVAGK